MIHYHGGPITPNATAIAAWTKNHAMVSYERPEQIGLAAEVAQSFALDNGAFSAWRQGKPYNFSGYIDWVKEWYRHPGFDWAVIPDVIDGDEDLNDSMLDEWPEELWGFGVPVWHLHESLDRLEMLITDYRRVALGSSGAYSEPGTLEWWDRMSFAMERACDEQGRPMAKLHGLRMLDPTIFSQIPLASADSTNIARNHKRQAVQYEVSDAVAAMIMANRVEHHACAVTWSGSAGVQRNLELIG